MEIVALALFCAVLVACVAVGWNILYALSVGLVIFAAFARLRGHSWKDILYMMLKGIKGARNVIAVFVLIGILTALWRDCGTIPAIIGYSVQLISPGTFVLMTFILCSAVSVLTGTSFGTSATMGIICMTMSYAMGINPAWTGGAILSGSFFGDRCSPVSTSALLVSELTGTDIYGNIKRMIKTAAVPFVLSCAVYWAAGASCDGSAQNGHFDTLFEDGFVLSPVVLIPAAVIIVMSLLRVNVKITMVCSIFAAALVSIFVQHTEVSVLIKTALTGYRSESPEIAEMLDGGGVVSMLRVAAIVCISSAYAGIFEKTGILLPVKRGIEKFSGIITVYGTTLVTSVLTSAVACNQTLSIMLTRQVCMELYTDKEQSAIDLEDTAVIVAPLIPWSIACAVPLTSSGSPAISVFFACFLYILPVWRLMLAFVARKKQS